MWVFNCRCPMTQSLIWVPVIGHPCDHVPITWQIGVWRTNHDQEFCYLDIHTNTPIIVSITKFSIVIGSARAYLSRNQRAITWVSNYSCPIWTFCNWIPTTWFSHQFSLRSLAVFKGGNRDNKPQSHEEPGRETTEKSSLHRSFSRLCRFTHAWKNSLICQATQTNVNYARFNGFLRKVSYSFQRLWKALQTFSPQNSSNDIFNSEICYRISNWTSCHPIKGVIMLVNSNRPCAFALARFWIYSGESSLNCTPLGPITITNNNNNNNNNNSNNSSIV